MAQGDSISGSVNISDEQGDYGYFIQPSMGEVWLITWFHADSYMSPRLTNGVVVYEEPGYREFEIAESITTLEDKEIKLFIDHNFFIVLKGSHNFWWTGVQFK